MCRRLSSQARCRALDDRGELSHACDGYGQYTSSTYPGGLGLEQIAIW